MKINILEFSIGNHLFGIRTEFVKYIFEIEHVKPIPLMPEYVAGITVHGKNVYPVVCTEKLLEISKSCENLTGKTAIAVDVYGKYVAIAVDEINKIQEIEETEEGNDVINFYNLKGQIIEEITPVFLDRKIKVPPLKQKSYEFLTENKKIKEDERSFLIFKSGDKLFGIETCFVKKVEYIENVKQAITKKDGWVDRLLLVKDVPIKAVNFKKVLDLKGEKEENLLIIEKDRKTTGILVDEVVDIFSIGLSNISTGTDENEIFNEFITIDKQVIPVLSEKFIHEIIEKYYIKPQKNKNEKFSEKNQKIDVLVFKIGNEKFGIKMENVDEVLEYKEVHISKYPTEHPLIKGIVAKERESMFLISYEDVLNQKVDIEHEDTKIISIKEGNQKFALLISSIEDIQSVSEESIAEFETADSFIRGVIILKNKELVNLLNPKWNLPIMEEEQSEIEKL